MKNEELSSAEKKTEPANMSAGAEMLIERMKTNPEDFKFNGRFYRVVEASNQHIPHQGWVSARDAIAIRAAYEEHIQEADFTEWVYNEIFNPKEPEKDLNRMYAQSLATSMQQTKQAVAGSIIQSAFSDPRTTFGSPLQGIKNKLGL